MVYRFLIISLIISTLVPLTVAADSAKQPADKGLGDAVSRIIGKQFGYYSARGSEILMHTATGKSGLRMMSHDPLDVSVHHQKRIFFGADSARQLNGYEGVDLKRGNATLKERTRLVINKDKAGGKKLNVHQVIANRRVGTKITINGVTVPVTKRDSRMSKNTAVLKSLTSQNTRRIRGLQSTFHRYGSRTVTLRRATVRISSRR